MPRFANEHQWTNEQTALEHDVHAPLCDDQAQDLSDAAVSELADLRRQVETLHRAVRARDDFIAIAAHELRNPMTPLLGVADLALAAAHAAGDTCPARITMLLERLQLIADEFISRSTRLLDFSRIEAGNLRLAPSSADLSAIVLSTARKYETAAARVCSPMELGIQNGVAGIFDHLAVEQVMENLLSNALKFGAGKPVTVRLRSHGAAASLDVRDRGIGMQPEQQARIFGRFEQVIAQHRGGGFGIGLWVTHNLVTAMGGKIAVLSRPGEGSTFTVTLPLSPRAPDGITYDAA